MHQDQRHDNAKSQAMGQGTDRQHESPVAVQKSLKGIHYPASKDDLLRQAQQNSASDGVMRKIRALPGDHYDKPTDVMKALGKTE